MGKVVHGCVDDNLWIRHDEISSRAGEITRGSLERNPFEGEKRRGPLMGTSSLTHSTADSSHLCCFHYRTVPSTYRIVLCLGLYDLHPYFGPTKLHPSKCLSEDISCHQHTYRAGGQRCLQRGRSTVRDHAPSYWLGYGMRIHCRPGSRWLSASQRRSL